MGVREFDKEGVAIDAKKFMPRKGPRPFLPKRWLVERTISWLVKRRGLRTRWAKKAENWLSFVQLACAHILLNLAVLGEAKEGP